MFGRKPKPARLNLSVILNGALYKAVTHVFPERGRIIQIHAHAYNEDGEEIFVRTVSWNVTPSASLHFALNSAEFEALQYGEWIITATARDAKASVAIEVRDRSIPDVRKPTLPFEDLTTGLLL